jgi:hypothetical protein
MRSDVRTWGDVVAEGRCERTLTPHEVRELMYKLAYEMVGLMREDGAGAPQWVHGRVRGDCVNF